MPPHSPLPVEALWVPGLPNTVQITFDRTLLAGPLNFNNWKTRWAGLTRNATAAAALGHVVTVSVAPGPADPGIDRVSFEPPPFDVVSALGGVAPAFADFPLV